MAYTGQFQVFEDIIKEIMVVYKHDSRPWLIGYSGGKDSTLLTCLVYEAMNFIAQYEGEIPGTTSIECGNYLEHDLSGAKQEAAAIAAILKDWTEDMIYYKE